METLIEYDQELFLFLNSLGTETWDGFWLVVTNKLSSIPLYALLLFFIYQKFGIKGMFMTMVIVAVMITCTDQISDFFKNFIQRPRPCKVFSWEETMRFIAPRCGRYGYFSGHATSSMATAVFAGLALQSKYRNLVFILLFWAAAIGYSRIYVGVHYPLDVLTGMMVGALLGYGFYRLQTYLTLKYT
ncbi:phosphatase PAP2 family protein [uncultured Dokdonia sp.]|uniref:phosphatase PAP2 family protein n=1 Tax=uncultured Dokdonia sp. TaxID=575653 RepID=UPI0026362132|nr:phosphatase PAP2 family protein [uncultured Dokdonia sp.]